MPGELAMITTKADAYSMIEAMSEKDFSELCTLLNSIFEKSEQRKAAEAKFVAEVKAAEESVSNGNYVTLPQLHEFLGM
ncbi:MAG: hypothetical protein K5891_03515 [Lachnospiraceae bacterium]|nr:hypothetical protein [Lachnospiraceae bacterium]